MRQSETDSDSMATDSLPEFGVRRTSAPTQPPIWMWVAILIVVAGGIYWFSRGNLFQSNVYQAVFLSNGQVYFGKTRSLQGKYVLLDDVYYVQWQQQQQGLDATTEGQLANPVSVPILLRRGQEEHRPFGSLRLNRDQIVAIENVGPDSPVMEQIKQLSGK